MTVFPIDVDVSDIKQPFKRGSFEGQTKRMPDEAPRTVASDKISGVDRFSIAVCSFDRRTDAVIVLGEAYQFGLPPHSFTLRKNMIVEKLLVLSLFDDQNEWVRAHSLTDFAQIKLTTDFTTDDKPRPFGLPAEADEFVGQTD